MSESGRLHLGKVRLAARVLRAYLVVVRGVARTPLPEFVSALGAPKRGARDHHPPRRVSRAVHSLLRVGSRRPRCLIGALVVFRVLREQGDAVELVIGLPDEGEDHTAHAWVEMGGRDIGPPPGRGVHTEMVRYR